MRRALLLVALPLVALLAAPGHAGAATPVQWCGIDRVATDRLPDTTTGRQVHLIYAIPSDGQDRLLEVAPVISSDLAETDAWWRRNDPTRTPRFDTFAFPNCTSTFGALDISTVRLPQPGSFYAPESTRADRLQESLGPSFDNPFKKYVAYYDGPLTEPVRICGESSALFDRGGSFSFAFIYFQASQGCRDRLAPDFRFAVTTTHELTHLLGALPVPGPPHACPGDAGHPCDDPSDILHPDAQPNLDAVVLDVGRDDYYAHPGPWPDIQDSLWLSRLNVPRQRLTVTVAGRSGTVSADLPGLLDCAATCATDWDGGTVLTLDARAASGAVFRGWSGACVGTAPCVVTLDAARAATATFATPTRLTVSVAGAGTVASSPAGITCPGACAADFDSDSRVTLQAAASAGFRFAGWSGACSGSASVCSVALDAAKSVAARFERVLVRLAVSVRGQGTVTSAPGGVRCRPTCAASFSQQSRVRLTARPARGWRFSRWSGACTGSRGCTVTMSAAKRVQALFERR